MSPQVALKKLDALRLQLAEKTREHLKVANAPPSRADVCEAVRGYAERAAAEALRPLAYKLASMGGAENAPFNIRSNNGTVDLAPLLCVLLGPDRLVELLEPVLSTLPDGMGTAEKRAALRTLDAEILALQHEEETVIEDLESQGVHVTRRGDADPAIVLREAAP